MNLNLVKILNVSKRKNVFIKPPKTGVINDVMKEFELNRDEAVLFSVVAKLSFETGYSQSLRNIRDKYKLSDKLYMDIIKNINTLQKKNLIVIEKARRASLNVNPEVELDEGIFNYLVTGKDSFSECNFSDMYSILDFAKDLIDQRDDEKISLKQFYNKVEKLIEKMDKKLDIYHILIQYPTIEKIMLFYAIIEYLTGRGDTNVSRFSDDIFDTLSDIAKLNSKFVNNELKIIKDKVIEFVKDSDLLSDPEFKLSEKTVRKLFASKNKKKNEKEFSSTVLDFTKYKSIKNNIYLNKKNEKDVSLIENSINYKNFNRVKKELKQSGFKSGFVALFYGEAGTGKTASAHVLSTKTKRHILQVDISRIQDMWVGNSEKNMKKIFDDYRRAKKEFKREPILLFNEADALIGKRINISSSVDSMNNAMQNILLEELENFEGIFIATTNLIENMDNAFSRRFLFKLEFEKPDKNARILIWKDKLKTLEEKDYINLSEHKLTGAQIENISKKFLLNSVFNKKKADFSNLTDLVNEEIKFKKEKGISNIGF